MILVSEFPSSGPLQTLCNKNKQKNRGSGAERNSLFCGSRGMPAFWLHSGSLTAAPPQSKTCSCFVGGLWGAAARIWACWEPVGGQQPCPTEHGLAAAACSCCVYPVSSLLAFCRSFVPSLPSLQDGSGPSCLSQCVIRIKVCLLCTSVLLFWAERPEEGTGLRAISEFF